MNLGLVLKPGLGSNIAAGLNGLTQACLFGKLMDLDPSTWVDPGLDSWSVSGLSPDTVSPELTRVWKGLHWYDLQNCAANVVDVLTILLAAQKKNLEVVFVIYFVIFFFGLNTNRERDCCNASTSITACCTPFKFRQHLYMQVFPKPDIETPSAI